MDGGHEIVEGSGLAMPDDAAKTAGRRLPGLDGVHAISIALVILSHAVNFSTGADLPVIRDLAAHGSFGVEIFFVLSGFLITWLLLREEESAGHIAMRQFYVRRALRILPPALFYLAGC